MRGARRVAPAPKGTAGADPRVGKPARKGVAARPVGPRKRGAQARRPRPPLRRRLRPRLPSAARTIATLGIALAIAGLVAGLSGPWLRVERIAYAGERFTSQQTLSAALAPANGAPLLALDAVGIAQQLRELPAVADARVEARLPNEVSVTVTEKEPAFVWKAQTHRLIGAADGTLIGEVAPSEALTSELAALPYVDDRRGAADELNVGSRIEPEMLATALRLVALDPARLGSDATRLSVQVDDVYGFILVATKPAWRVAFGYYGLDPMHAQQPPAQEIERQVGAVRTLFATHDEATVSWVDARNPGKVYFRAKG